MRNRSTLTLRNPGVEKLLVGLPDYAKPDALEPIRQWAIAMMTAASRWDLDKRKRNAGALFGGRRNG